MKPYQFCSATGDQPIPDWAFDHMLDVFSAAGMIAMGRQSKKMSKRMLASGERLNNLLRELNKAHPQTPERSNFLKERAQLEQEWVQLRQMQDAFRVEKYFNTEWRDAAEQLLGVVDRLMPSNTLAWEDQEELAKVPAQVRMMLDSTGKLK